MKKVINYEKDHRRINNYVFWSSLCEVIHNLITVELCGNQALFLNLFKLKILIIKLFYYFFFFFLWNYLLVHQIFELLFTDKNKSVHIVSELFNTMLTATIKITYISSCYTHYIKIEVTTICIEKNKYSTTSEKKIL